VSSGITSPYTLAIGSLFICMYVRISLFVQKEIGELLGRLLSKELHPYRIHVLSLNLDSAAIIPVILAFLTVFAGCFFNILQQRSDILKGAFSRNKYLPKSKPLFDI